MEPPPPLVLLLLVVKLILHGDTSHRGAMVEQRPSFQHYGGAIILRRLFLKGCSFGSKSGTKSLIRRNQAKVAKTAPEYLKVCHIWLIKFKKQLMFSYIFIHIIQLSLFSSEYLPIAGKKVNIYY